MGIAASSYTIDAHRQVDGSRYCKEFHTADDGRVITTLYKLTDGMDPDALLAARAAMLNESMAEREFEQIVDDGA